MGGWVILVASIVFVGMTVYEFSKQVYWPGMTLWQSHAITIVMSTVIATVAVYFVLRKQQSLMARVVQEVAERWQMEMELKQYRDRLEELVAERTAELTAVNQNLQAEIAYHRQADTALRESEATARVLLDSPIDAIFLLDVEGRFLNLNETTARRFSYSAAELIGKSSFELIPPEVAEFRRGKLAEVVRSGKLLRFEDYREGMWNDNVFAPVLDEQGRVKKIAVWGRDITGYKRMVEALRQSEERFARIFNASPAPTVVSKFDGEYYIDVNQSFSRMVGYARQEILARTATELAIWTDPQVYEAIIDQLHQRIPLSDMESRICTKTGEARDILVSATTVRIGEEDFILFLFHDITERKQAEAALQRRNNELALLNHASQAFNSTLDLDVVLVTILEGVRYLMKVVGVTIWLINPETHELVCQQASGSGSENLCGWRLASGQGIAGWTVNHNESVIVADTRADSRHFHGVYQQLGVELRAILSVPLRIKEGVIGVLQVVDAEVNRFEPTDLNLLEPLASTAAIAIENARLYIQAKRDARTKAVLLNEVNHRVKNNLSAIIGLLYIEQRHTGIANQAIYRAVMDDLIQRIQGLATVHQMLSNSEWAPLLLTELTERIINSVLQGHQREVVIEICPSAVAVTAEQANNLALVISELATNTVKYGLSSGRITRLKVDICLEADKVQFEFRDDGPGYPPGMLQLEQYNVGIFLIQTIVRDGLRGEVNFRNDSGAVAVICFKVAT